MGKLPMRWLPDVLNLIKKFPLKRWWLLIRPKVVGPLMGVAYPTTEDTASKTDWVFSNPNSMG